MIALYVVLYLIFAFLCALLCEWLLIRDREYYTNYDLFVIELIVFFILSPIAIGTIVFILANKFLQLLYKKVNR